MAVLFKKCSGECGQTKPAAEFSKCSKSTDGLQSWCRECQKKARRRSREATGSMSTEEHKLTGSNGSLVARAKHRQKLYDDELNEIGLVAFGPRRAVVHITVGDFSVVLSVNR